MEKKKGRGRPRVTENIAGENSKAFEKIITNGKVYRSRRSIADIAYMFTAVGILSEAASEIEGLELLMDHQSQYGCRSILNQLGRMYRTEGYGKKRILSASQKPLYRTRKTVTV